MEGTGRVGIVCCVNWEAPPLAGNAGNPEVLRRFLELGMTSEQVREPCSVYVL